MNIKLKAALEVTGIVLGAAAVAVAVNYGLESLAAAYGDQAVIKGITALFLGAAVYTCVGLLYDQRVAKLQYREKLKEITQK